MKSRIFFYFLLVILGLSNGELQRFDNHIVLDIIPGSNENVKILRDLMNAGDKYDFWSEPSSASGTVKVRVQPDVKDEFLELLETNHMTHAVAIEDLQKLISTQNITSYTRNTIRQFDFDSYHDLETINTWIEDLESTYPDRVTRIVGGRTFQGREIVGVKISHNSGRRAIFIECGIHSREWIAVATGSYIINELLTSTNTGIRNLASDFDWYIFPVVNADGYVFTHTTNRMWRKTRSTRAQTSAVGVDPNRNWNYQWNWNGTSMNPASDVYAGLGPFSEAETRTLSDYIRGVASDLDMYLSIHSFGQLLLIPYGSTALPVDNYWDALYIGRLAMGALRQKYNTDYNVGNVVEAIYPASGSSVDWVKGTFGVPLAYVYELRDRGQFGFLLPANQIRSTGEETMDSLIGLVENGRNFNYFGGRRP